MNRIKILRALILVPVAWIIAFINDHTTRARKNLFCQ